MMSNTQFTTPLQAILISYTQEVKGMKQDCILLDNGGEIK